eukprot:64546_1
MVAIALAASNNDIQIALQYLQENSYSIAKQVKSNSVFAKSIAINNHNINDHESAPQKFIIDTLQQCMSDIPLTLKMDGTMGTMDEFLKESDAINEFEKQIERMENVSGNHNILIDEKQNESVQSKMSNPNKSMKCTLSADKCPFLSTLSEILFKYDVYNITKNDNSLSILKHVYPSDYSNSDLLNDYNHLLFQHDTEFQTIYNVLINKLYNNKSCQLCTCLCNQRNRRDRSKVSRNENILKQLYHDIVEEQLLDRIHCYFLHSLDCGYKINTEEKENIATQKLNIVKQKTHTLNKYNKFVTT